MLVIQSNCKSCRCLTGSKNIECLYADTEVDFEGETNVYEFAGGSGFINKASFCSKCNLRVYSQPDPEVMECMVSMPLGCFNNTNELGPKVKIWSEGKLTFLSKSECILESFEVNGIPVRFNALLSSLESLQEFSFFKKAQAQELFASVESKIFNPFFHISVFSISPRIV